MHVAVERRKDSLGKPFLTLIPFVDAAKGAAQQEEPEELQPDSPPPWGGPVGRQGKVLDEWVVTGFTFRACGRAIFLKTDS